MNKGSMAKKNAICKDIFNHVMYIEAVCMSVCSHFDLPVELISSLHASEHITRSGYNEKFAKGPIITFPVTSPDSGNTVPHRAAATTLKYVGFGPVSKKGDNYF